MPTCVYVYSYSSLVSQLFTDIFNAQPEVDGGTAGKSSALLPSFYTV